jgi:hypothetical protein
MSHRSEHWSARVKRITAEKIEKIAKKLRQLPPVQKKPEYSAEEAIGMLKGEITAMRKRGYSLLQVADALRAEGLEIDTLTLKGTLQPPAEPPSRPQKASSKKVTPIPTKAAVKAKNPTTVRPSRAPKSRRSYGAMFELKPDTEDL